MRNEHIQKSLDHIMLHDILMLNMLLPKKY